MKLRFKLIGGAMKWLLSFLTTVLFLCSISFAQNSAESNFSQLAGEAFENLQTFYPVISTGRGIHKYDYLLTDYSPKSISAEIGKLKKFQSRLSKIKVDVLSSESRIDWKLIKSNVDIALQNLDRIKWYQKCPYIYADDAVNGVYLISISEYAPLEVRVQNIIARMKVVPDLFTQAKINLKKPAPIYVKMAQEMLTTGMDFYRSLAEDLKSQLPALAPEVEGAAGKVIAAMKDFHKYLSQLSPGGEGSFAIGKTEFDYKLKNEYFLDYDADSLLKIGETLFRQADSMYGAYETWLDSNRTEIDSVYPYNCISKDEILSYYKWEVEQTKLYLSQKNIVTIPDDVGDCVVMETPAFLRNIISSIAYEPPGPFNPEQTGHFYVRPLPDTLDDGQRAVYSKFINRRGFKGSVVHEAYPGHHLQSVMSSRVFDDIHKWQNNLCYVEGWAMYCEEMMYDNGFYGADKRRYLGALGGIMFRAARIIVDVKLQTEKMTINEAVDWMTKALDSDSNFIRTEVNRYTYTPTVPMSYLIGKTEIVKLRDAMKAREGERFSLKAFHDRYLSEGMIPPRLLWEIWGL